MELENESLAGVVILEVGSGRGDTTRSLVDLLSGQPGTRLIVTDISDRFFAHLQDEFQSREVQVQFIRTQAQELRGIADGSVDHLVCSYTLCAVNSQAGMTAIALQRFWQVLKPGGKLWLEEEFPIDMQDTPAQSVWAEKWRILKAARVLTGRLPYQELAPQVLEAVCRMVGFESVRWTSHSAMHPVKALDFFQKRLDSMLAELTYENLRLGFVERAQKLYLQAVQVGGIEVPYYRLQARKPSP